MFSLINKVLAIVLLPFIISCKPAAVDPELLPKDIAFKPKRDTIVSPSNPINSTPRAEITMERLQEMKAEILALISQESCEDPSQWRISPMGSKPCGGPSEYIAYPKKIEDQLLPKIQRFTGANSRYNRINNLVSDCNVITPPTRIVCENGSAVLK